MLYMVELINIELSVYTTIYNMCPRHPVYPLTHTKLCELYYTPSRKFSFSGASRSLQGCTTRAIGRRGSVCGRRF